MNPIFDRESFVADPEAHKMSDGRLYVYGSLDISGKKIIAVSTTRCFQLMIQSLKNGRITEFLFLTQMVRSRWRGVDIF